MGLEKAGKSWSKEEEEAFKLPIREQYEMQGHPYYASARLWDDGVIDPAADAARAGAGHLGQPQCADREDDLRRVQDVDDGHANPSTRGMESIYITPEHVALREQVARFLAKEVEPHGEAWEEQGYVPREVLRKMGGLGLLGITYPQQYGGAEADALTSLVFAEALSRSTFGGFIVTVLVHTDMASPHLVHAGSKAQLERYLPRVIRGEAITRGCHHGARCRLGRGAASAPVRGAMATIGCSMAARCSSPTACTPICILWRRGPIRMRKARAAHLDVHRREGRTGLSRRPCAEEDRLAVLGYRRTRVR